MDGMQDRNMNEPDFKSYELTAPGRNLVLDAPKIMAILNCTPDSFYDGGRFNAIDSAIERGLDLLDQGADIIDIGGQSTRPGATEIDVAEEWSRIGAVIQGVLDRRPDAWISVDTHRAEIAQRALESGAAMINDISSGTLDPEMLAVVAQHNVPMVLMHMQGTPETMQNAPHYDNAIEDVYRWLEKRVNEAHDAGIRKVLVDVGFGFGKSMEHNYALLAGLDRFHGLEAPIMAGLSRKSMIWKALNGTPETALNGTTAAHAWALERGAHVLRVHDVVAAKETVALHALLRPRRP
jgi:dihydropteroate synthase